VLRTLAPEIGGRLWDPEQQLIHERMKPTDPPPRTFHKEAHRNAFEDYERACPNWRDGDALVLLIHFQPARDTLTMGRLMVARVAAKHARSARRAAARAG
jgi:hypothetical protein